MNQNEINKLADTLLNVTTNVTDSKVNGAQYDKSFQTKIIGINQVFSDEVPETTQQTLIKKYAIEEDADPCYYTFLLDENYYVKQSDVKFQLYQDVVIRVPNGNWDRMYIEGSDNQKETEEIRYTPGQGITIKDKEIGLKVAGTGRYWDGNWKNLIGGIFIDSSTARSGESLSVDHMGTLQLKPATKNSLGGVKPGKNISIERDGTINVDNSSSTRLSHCIAAQGYWAYQLGFLRAGAEGGLLFDRSWRPRGFARYSRFDGTVYIGNGIYTNLYFEYDGSYTHVYARDYSGGKKELNNPQNPFYSDENWSYNGLVFVADAVIPSGVDPWDKECPYGCASVLLYFIYLYKGNNPKVRIDAVCSAPLRIPFSSEAEYKNAQAAM